MNKRGFLDDIFQYISIGAFVILFAIILLVYGATQKGAAKFKADNDLRELQASEALHDYLQSTFDKKLMAEYVTTLSKEDKNLAEWQSYTSNYFGSRLPGKKFSLYTNAGAGVGKPASNLKESAVAYLPSETQETIELLLLVEGS